MQFLILGPLQLSNDGRVATPTAPKPRSVLGLLLLNTDRTVQVSALIRDLWGASPPVSAVTTLQTYILQIRKSLGQLLGISVSEVAQRLLITVPEGYLLRTAAAEFDRRTFDHLDTAGAFNQRAGADSDAGVIEGHGAARRPAGAGDGRGKLHRLAEAARIE